MKKLNWLLVVLFLISSCGKDSDPPAAVGCGDKNLFSTWTVVDGNVAVVIDMSAGVMGNNVFVFQHPSGELCQSDVLLSGDQCSGTANIANSAYTGGGGGDPGCAGFDGTETYAKSANGLMFCSDGSCVTYE